MEAQYINTASYKTFLLYFQDNIDLLQDKKLCSNQIMSY